MRTWVSLAMVWLAACGTSTGNPVDGDDPPGVPGDRDPQQPPPPDTHENTAGQFRHCDAHPSELDSEQAQTALGFAPADVLAFAAELHETSIRWLPSEIASYGPESGEHALSVRVTHAGGAIRYVEYTPKASSSGEEPAINIGGPDCASLAAVEIEVELEIRSDGGALDEHVTGTLRASSADWATLAVALDVEELGGAFAVESTRPAGFELERLTLDLGLSPLGLRGSLSGLLTMTTAEVAAAGNAQFAAIGASCADGLGLAIALDQPLGAMTGQDALDLVASLGGLSAAWSDGSRTEVDLSLMHDGQSVCAILEPMLFTGEPSPPSLRVHGRLRAQSADQRLDADWPVVLEAIAGDDGELGEAVLTLDYEALGMIGAQDFARVVGIAGLDPSGYDGFQIRLELRVQPGASGAAATGTLGVNGFTLPDCAMAEPAPPPAMSSGASGGGSPGCPGADVTELESLAF